MEYPEFSFPTLPSWISLQHMTLLNTPFLKIYFLSLCTLSAPGSPFTSSFTTVSLRVVFPKAMPSWWLYLTSKSLSVSQTSPLNFRVTGLQQDSTACSQNHLKSTYSTATNLLVICILLLHFNMLYHYAVTQAKNL